MADVVFGGLVVLLSLPSQRHLKKLEVGIVLPVHLPKGLLFQLHQQQFLLVRG